MIKDQDFITFFQDFALSIAEEPDSLAYAVAGDNGYSEDWYSNTLLAVENFLLSGLMYCTRQNKKISNDTALNLLKDANKKVGDPYNSAWSSIFFEPTSKLENILDDSGIYKIEDCYDLDYVYKPLQKKLLKAFDVHSISNESRKLELA